MREAMRSRGDLQALGVVDRRPSCGRRPPCAAEAIDNLKVAILEELDGSQSWMTRVDQRRQFGHRLLPRTFAAELRSFAEIRCRRWSINAYALFVAAAR
jgi:hypothetical protein